MTVNRRRKDGTLLIFAAGTLTMLVLFGTAYAVVRILADAIFRVPFWG
jgi:hypothetical protein